MQLITSLGLLAVTGKPASSETRKPLRHLTTSLQIALILENQKSVQDALLEALNCISEEFDQLSFYESIKSTYRTTDFDRIT